MSINYRDPDQAFKDLDRAIKAVVAEAGKDMEVIIDLRAYVPGGGFYTEEYHAGEENSFDAING